MQVSGLTSGARELTVNLKTDSQCSTPYLLLKGPPEASGGNGVPALWIAAYDVDEKCCGADLDNLLQIQIGEEQG